MIPKILWQTYKSKFPPKQACDLIHSWLSLNPSLEWYYMDDEKCDLFIKEHFNTEFYEMYKSLPLGVMRADVWRVAIVYVYGGIYADIDTKCLKSIPQWISDNDSLIVGVETPNGSINNYIFAAEPKHPALYHVLKMFLTFYNSSEYLKTNVKTVVQNFGANAWSYGILDYYKLSDKESMSKGGNYYNSSKLVKKDRTKFYTFESNAFSPVPCSKTYINHQAASVIWKNNYDSWRDRQKEMFGV